MASFFHNVLPPTIQERSLERSRSFAPTSDLAFLVQQVDMATGQLLPLLCIIARGEAEDSPVTIERSVFHALFSLL